MRKEIERWLEDPSQQRRYARIEGILAFDEECDEVKMERKSQLEKKEE